MPKLDYLNIILSGTVYRVMQAVKTSLVFLVITGCLCKSPMQLELHAQSLIDSRRFIQTLLQTTQFQLGTAGTVSQTQYRSVQ